MNLERFIPAPIVDKIKARSAHKLWEGKRNNCDNFPVVWAAVPDAVKPAVKNALEFGANWSGNLQEYLATVPGARATGVDINPVVTELAATEPRYRGIVGNQTVLSDFADNEFDLAYTVSVLDHIPGEKIIARTIEQLARIAKTVIMVEPFIAGQHGDISGKAWGDVDPVALLPRLREPPYSVQDRSHKLFAAHSYAWDYDAILDHLGLTWSKTHTPLHDHGMGPWYHSYIVSAPAS